MRAGDLKLGGSRPGREDSSDSIPQRDAPLPPKLRLSCDMSNSIVLAPGETKLIGRHPRCDMRFPIDDRRQSGFLWPTLGFSGPRRRAARRSRGSPAIEK